jgi:hypothetical protein
MWLDEILQYAAIGLSNVISVDDPAHPPHEEHPARELAVSIAFHLTTPAQALVLLDERPAALVVHG